MNKKKGIALTIFLIFTLIFSTGCRKSYRDDSITSEDKKELLVAAAASLTNSFTEIGAFFETENNCTVIFSFAATGTLSEQINHGAPFDVFAVANVKDLDKLSQDGRILEGTQTIFAMGQLGIASLKNSDIKVSSLEDLLKPEIKRIAIASPEHAPYGLAAKEALITSGLWDKLESKIVFGKNTSETMTFLITGNVEVGFLALSQKDEALMDFTLVDSNLHQPLNQAMGVLTGTKEEELGKKFIQFILSERGQEVMNNYGFVLPLEE